MANFKANEAKIKPRGKNIKVQMPTKENSKFIELQTMKVQTKHRTKWIETKGEISRRGIR